MFSSLQSWCNNKVDFQPFLHLDGMGDRTYGPKESIDCYIEGKIELVRNLNGDQIVSTRKVYIKVEEAAKKFWPYREGSTSGKPVAADLLIIDSITYPVLALQAYYLAGKFDLLVVYV